MSKKIAFTIYIDELTGDVEEVKTTKRFAEEGALFRMDVIKDTIKALYFVAAGCFLSLASPV